MKNIPKPAQYILNFLLGYIYTILSCTVFLIVFGIAVAIFGGTLEQPWTGLSFALSIAFLVYAIVKKANFFITK